MSSHWSPSGPRFVDPEPVGDDPMDSTSDKKVATINMHVAVRIAFHEMYVNLFTFIMASVMNKKKRTGAVFCLLSNTYKMYN